MINNNRFFEVWRSVFVSEWKPIDYNIEPATKKFHALIMQFMLLRLQMINSVKYYLKIKNPQGQSTQFREQCTYMYMLSWVTLFFTVERDIISGKIRTQRTHWYMFFMMQLSFANYNKVYKVKGKENNFSQKYR